MTGKRKKEKSAGSVHDCKIHSTHSHTHSTWLGRRGKRVQEGYMTACFTALTQSHSQYMTVKKKNEKGAGRVHDCMFQSTHTVTLTVQRLWNRRRKRVQEGYMTACFTALTSPHSQYTTGKWKKEKDAWRVHDCMFHSTHSAMLTVQRLWNRRRKRVQEGYMTACFKALTPSHSQYHNWETEGGKGCRKGTWLHVSHHSHCHPHSTWLGNRRRKRAQEGYMIVCFTALTQSHSQYTTGK